MNDGRTKFYHQDVYNEPMRQITIEIDDETAKNLDKLAELCTQAQEKSEGFTSHGKITVPSLLAMLAEDAGMVISRPGSWEGSNMATVLRSHGYEF